MYSSHYNVHDQFKHWNIDELYKFETWFPNLIGTIVQYFENVQEPSKKYTLAHQTPHLPGELVPLSEQIVEVIPVWKTLYSYSSGFICYHVFRVFYCLLHDVNYYVLNKYDRNVLLWTNLFHDISKRGRPVIEGKDNIHPFKSACTALHVMQDSLHWIELDKQAWDIWDTIFDNAYMTRNEEIVQDHSKLKDIKAFLDRHIGDNQFILDIIYLTLLHQSLPNMKEFKHKSIIHPLEDIRLYFDTRRMKLMKLFMINDSTSYTMYKDKHCTVHLSSQIESYVNILIQYLQSLETFDRFAIQFGEIPAEQIADKLPKIPNGKVTEQKLLEGVLIQHVQGNIVQESSDAIGRRPNSSCSAHNSPT